MYHGFKKRKLNMTSSHRKMMLANMAVSLLIHEQIKTTVPKAKELRPYVEKLITLSKRGGLSVIRALLSKIHDKQAVTKLCSTLAERYADRPGGYLRIIKAGHRYGDMAPLAYIELVDRNISAKGNSDDK